MKLTFRLRLLIGPLAALYLVVSGSTSLLPGISTQAGERRSITLEDGSVIQMGPRTRLVPRFNGQQRFIDHVSGKAIYTVQKDPTRPFVVRTQLALVEAVGTKFGIDHQPQTTAVATTEGEVVIARTQPIWNRALAESIHAVKGQQVVVELHRPMVARSIGPDDALAWEKGIVVFRQTPVEEALLQFNRWNPVPLSMPNHPNVLSMRITGRFKIDEPGAFYEYLETALNERQALPR